MESLILHHAKLPQFSLTEYMIDNIINRAGGRNNIINLVGGPYEERFVLTFQA